MTIYLLFSCLNIANRAYHYTTLANNKTLNPSVMHTHRIHAAATVAMVHNMQVAHCKCYLIRVFASF